MLLSTVLQSTLCLAMLSSVFVGGWFLHRLQQTSNEFLVSKDSWDDTKVGTSNLNYKCKVKNTEYFDNDCQIFAIEKTVGKVAGIKEFKSATTALTEKTIKENNFFKMKLNTHKLAKIDISEIVIIDVVKKDDDSDVASFRIHSKNVSGVFETYVRYFLAKKDQEDETEGFGSELEINYFQCKPKKFLHFSDDYVHCEMDIVKPDKFININPKTLDVNYFKPLWWETIPKEYLKKDTYYIIKSSRKYLNSHLNSEFIFEVKITDKSPIENNAKNAKEKKLELKYISSIAVREETEKEKQSSITSPKINKDKKTKIKDIFLN